jgi:ketosteroid isomerase-like protein
MKRLVILAVFALAVPVLALGQSPAARQSAAEKAVREADAALAKAVAAKALDECLALFDDEAALPGDEGTVYRAKDPRALRGAWEQSFSTPGFDLKWTAEHVIVLKSGTLAYSSGTWNNGPAKGTFFVVWRKQPDGKWKVLVDAPWMMPAEKK